jgi:large subunit ribosomal protein L25
MAEVLNVALRSGLGKRAMRRLREQGRTPAVLYGHGLDNVNLSICSRELGAVVRHGAKLVDVRGDVTDSALVKSVQWNTFGTEVLHVDLTRVSAEEAVDVTVAVTLVGEAPGVKAGGIIEHFLHEVEIRCPAGALPDRFAVRINELQVGGTILAKDIKLPAGAELLSDPDAVVCHCEMPLAMEEEPVPAAEGAAEPELIRRKEEEEESEG